MRFPPIFLFLTIGLLLYFPVFFAGFAGDDQPHFSIVEKNYVGDVFAPFDHVVGAPADNRLLGYFYRPLPFSVYTVISDVAPANPLPFHVLQVVLYILAVYLFFLFCTRFFHKKIALLLGLIFLIHPANNDLGAYIAALDETLCLLFGLLALLAIKKNPSVTRLGVIFGALLLALFSKETGVIFVAIAILYSGYKKVFASLFPIVISFVTYMVFRMNAAFSPVYGLTPSPTGDLSFIQHVFLAVQIAFAFVREIVMPTRAGIKADAFDSTWQSSIFPLIMLVVCIAAIVGIWVFLKKRHEKQAALFGFFSWWVLLGIPLHLQFIPLEVIFADRWLYISEMGMLGMFGVVLGSVSTQGKWFPLLRALFIILLFFYAIETFVLNIMWLEWEKYFT